LAQASFQFRGIILHPPPNRDVVDQKPALSQEFLYVAIREREAQIPADGQENTSDSNCRHLNRPQTEEARRSIRAAYPG